MKKHAQVENRLKVCANVPAKRMSYKERMVLRRSQN